jgi:hypothetical protein
MNRETPFQNTSRRTSSIGNVLAESRSANMKLRCLPQAFAVRCQAMAGKTGQDIFGLLALFLATSVED